MQLTVTRRHRFFACLCRTDITVMTEDGAEAAKLQLEPGQEKTLTLPGQRYILRASTGTPLMRTIEKTVLCPGDILFDIRIEVDIVHYNLPAAIIPGVALAVPIFEYKLTLQNGNALCGRKKLKIPGMLFRISGFLLLLYAVPFFLMNLSALYLFDTEKPVVWALKGSRVYAEQTADVLGDIIAYWIIPVILVLLARLLLRLSRRLLRERRDQVSLPDIRPPFILYLRSFHADTVTKKPADGIFKPEQTEEELLVSILNDIAPVVAIGRPGEKYLPKGASRLYVADAVWQQRVTELAEQAEFAVLRLGGTEGFWWEVEFCLEQLPPEKLLFVVPAMKSPALWDEFRDRLRAHGVRTALPPVKLKKRGKSSIAGFLTLQADKTTAFKPLRRRKILDFFISADDILREALADFLRIHGGYVKRRSNVVWAAVCWAAVIFSCLIMGLNSWLKFQKFEQNRFPKDLVAWFETLPQTQGQLNSLSDRGKMYVIFTDFTMGTDDMSEQSMLELYRLTSLLLGQMQYWEYELLTEQLMEDFTEHPMNLLIMAKKYFNDDGYALYLGYLKEAVLAGMGQSEAPSYSPDSDVQEEYLRRLKQIPGFDEDQDWRVIHRYYLEARDALLQMYEEGYAVEELMRGGLIY